METGNRKSSPPLLRLGTRGSMLAQAQSRIVAGELEKLHSGLRVELRVIATSGDSIADRPLHEFGGKGLFTRELELALLEGSIDFAVHSFKDLPVTMPLVEQANLVVAAVPKREDSRDALICQKASSLAGLPSGARVGTGSLRRRCQILAVRPDLVIEPVRGNIDTRVRKLQATGFDAIVLAMAGARRAGIFDATLMHAIEPAELLPAPGQGALAIQCRRDDEQTMSLLAPMNHAVTEACVAAERELVRLLEGDCHSPIAALAEVEARGELRLRAVVGSRGGSPPVIVATATGSIERPATLAQRVFHDLHAQNVESLLQG